MSEHTVKKLLSFIPLVIGIAFFSYICVPNPSNLKNPIFYLILLFGAATTIVQFLHAISMERADMIMARNRTLLNSPIDDERDRVVATSSPIVATTTSLATLMRIRDQLIADRRNRQTTSNPSSIVIGTLYGEPVYGTSELDDYGQPGSFQESEPMYEPPIPPPTSYVESIPEEEYQPGLTTPIERINGDVL